MKLESATITNFRCIDDSTKFKMGQITCLVGKNESGKTAILHALTKLNPVDATLSKFDVERDYPRKLLNEFDETTRALETEWTLDAEDVAAVEAEIGPGALPSHTITITKAYDTTGSSWPLKVDEKKVIS